MDTGKILKGFIFIVVIAIAAPFLKELLPKPVTFERAVAAFKAAGFDVEDYAEREYPELDSVAQANMSIKNAIVGIYQYDDEGKIVRNLEYRKKDAGTAIVEAWGLAQSLGAAPSKNKPEFSARNGMFMIIATGDDEELLKRIVQIFKSL